MGIMFAVKLLQKLKVKKALVVTDHLRAVRGMRSTAKARALGGVGAIIRRSRRGMGMSVRWCPSHGKKPKWKPDAPFEAEGKLWRKLNEAADEECTKVLRSERGKDEEWLEEVREAGKWTTAALTQVSGGSIKFMDLARAPAAEAA